MHENERGMMIKRDYSWPSSLEPPLESLEVPKRGPPFVGWVVTSTARSLVVFIPLPSSLSSYYESALLPFIGDDSVADGNNSYMINLV